MMLQIWHDRNARLKLEVIMHLKTLRMTRSLFALSTLVLSSACLMTSSSATTPQSSSAITVFGQPTIVVDASITQLWQQQAALSSSLEAAGLIAHDNDEEHDMHTNPNGIGGNYEADNQVPTSQSDRISDVINQVADQVDRRDSNLHRLNQTLMSHNQDPVNVSADILAVEPVANAHVSSPYGYRTLGGREFHPGIDLAVPYGSPIYATGTGTVVYSGWKNGYGNFIEIDHGNGYVTRYGHSSRLLVSVGDHVDKNQEIALVGCTGRCTGPHVHYEVLYHGKRQNPATYLALAPRRED
jgi:murein DD-endopeptidase MepM/ murein hydrolase activator NlpD